MRLRITLTTTLIFAFAGCHKPQAASDGIREAIQRHLTSLNTLNLSAMNISITNVTIDRNTALAQAEFVPKSGAPAGAAMHVSYSLEKRDGKWEVVKTNSLGGAIDHPDPGVNPHAQVPLRSFHGNLPNLRDIIPSTTQGQNPVLPPGHPPLPSSEGPNKYRQP